MGTPRITRIQKLQAMKDGGYVFRNGKKKKRIFK